MTLNLPSTLNAGSPFKTHLNFRNNLFMLFKNLPASSLFISSMNDYQTCPRLDTPATPERVLLAIKNNKDFKLNKKTIKINNIF